MKTTLYLDQVSHDYIDELPRKVNASKIVRYVLKAIFADDAEWNLFLETDSDAAVLREYLHKKLRKRL